MSCVLRSQTSCPPDYAGVVYSYTCCLWCRHVDALVADRTAEVFLGCDGSSCLGHLQNILNCRTSVSLACRCQIPQGDRA